MLILKQFQKDYDAIKKHALRLYAKDELEDSLELVVIASRLAYHFNIFYTDINLENLLRNIVIKLFGETTDLEYRRDFYVFFDSFGWDNRGLTQQYIRALISWGVPFLYVLEDSSNVDKAKEIFSEIRAYSKAEILVLDSNLSRVQRIQKIRDIVISYRPQYVFLHIKPWSVEALGAFDRFKALEKFLINITDHAFWLGASFLDYCLEFKDYGYCLSLQKRNIPEEKLLLMPYYPIVNDKIQFQGFPVDTKGKIVLFSGGSFYKVFGANDTYFKMLERVFKDNQNIVLFYAGDGDESIFRNKLCEYGIEDKVFLLGNRPDINSLFRNCDIYIGTYPVPGALMTQLALVNQTPYISLHDDSIPASRPELFLFNAPSGASLSYTSVEEYHQELNKMITDEKHRKKKAEMFKDSVITAVEFSDKLKWLVQKHRNFKNICYVEDADKGIGGLFLDNASVLLKQYNSLIDKLAKISDLQVKMYYYMFRLRNIYKKVINIF